jgi:hypothetical protein
VGGVDIKTAVGHSAKYTNLPVFILKFYSQHSNITTHPFSDLEKLYVEKATYYVVS